MRKTPNIIYVENFLYDAVNEQANIDNRWVAARPEGLWSFRYRLKATWLVFTGKADALIWFRQ